MVMKVESSVTDRILDGEDRFKDWLRSRRDRPVGMVGVSSACPLANWMKEEAGVEKACVGGSLIWVGSKDNFLFVAPYVIDHWFFKVIEAVDSITVIPGSVVRGRDVLKRLEV